MRITRKRVGFGTGGHVSSNSTGWIRLLLPDVPSAAEVRPYLEQIDTLLWYTNFGPLASQFECELAAKVNVNKNDVAAFANCTLALEAGLSAILPPKGRVLLPALTFVEIGRAHV